MDRFGCLATGSGPGIRAVGQSGTIDITGFHATTAGHRIVDDARLTD